MPFDTPRRSAPGLLRANGERVKFNSRCYESQRAGVAPARPSNPSSRGYSAADAREMLVVGYFEDLLTSAPEKFKDNALAAIKGRLRAAA